MKNNYRRLGRIFKLFGAETFFVANLYDWQISLMAKFDPDLAKKIISKKFTSTGIDVNGFINFQRGSIKITLS